MEKLITDTIVSTEEIQEACIRLGKELTEYYEGKNPVAIGVLKGCYPFMSDLVRQIKCHLEIDHMIVSTYGGGEASTGSVKFIKDLDTNIEGRDVLIVEDIIDSGITLDYLKNVLESRNPKSVKIVTLLDKKSGRKVDIKPDWYGVDVPDAFLVGYGLDYKENYRNLPYIGVLDLNKGEK